MPQKLGDHVDWHDAHTKFTSKVRDVLQTYPSATWHQAFEVLDSLLGMLQKEMQGGPWALRTVSDCLVLICSKSELWKEASARVYFILRRGELMTENGMSACILTTQSRERIMRTARLCAAEGSYRLHDKALWHMTRVLNYAASPQPVRTLRVVASAPARWVSALKTLKWFQSGGSHALIAMWYSLKAEKHHLAITETLRTVAVANGNPLSTRGLMWLGSDAKRWVASVESWEQTLYLLKKEHAVRSLLSPKYRSPSLSGPVALAILHVACTYYPNTSYPYFVLANICRARDIRHQAVCRSLALLPINGPMMDRVYRYVRNVSWTRVSRQRTPLPDVEYAGRHLLQKGMWKQVLNLCKGVQATPRVLLEALTYPCIHECDTYAAYLAHRVAREVEFPFVSCQQVARRLFRRKDWLAGLSITHALASHLAVHEANTFSTDLDLRVVPSAVVFDEAAAHALNAGRWDMAVFILQRLRIAASPSFDGNHSTQDAQEEDWDAMLRRKYANTHSWKAVLSFLSGESAL